MQKKHSKSFASQNRLCKSCIERHWNMWNIIMFILIEVEGLILNNLYIVLLPQKKSIYYYYYNYYVWLILIYFKLIVMELILLYKPHAIMFLEPTSTKQWWPSFLLTQVNNSDIYLIFNHMACKQSTTYQSDNPTYDTTQLFYVSKLKRAKNTIICINSTSPTWISSPLFRPAETSSGVRYSANT